MFASNPLLLRRAITETAAVILFELATSTLVPLNAVSYSDYIKGAIEGSTQLKEDLKEQNIDIGILTRAIDKFSENAAAYESRKDVFLSSQRYCDVIISFPLCCNRDVTVWCYSAMITL